MTSTTIAEALACGLPACPCAVTSRRGTGLTHCPGHPDADPSLAITYKGGKTLVHCQAGCDQGMVISALRERGLWPATKSKPNGNAVAIYPYHDERGHLLFEVVKFPPKSFRPRRSDGNGGWVWNLDDTRRVLYRLPQLIVADPTETVYIVEGEKDADRLAALGLVTTTNPGGARRWRSEYGDHLKGRRVIIPPDNDEPGRSHAEDVAASLHAVAAEVRILLLPGLAEHGDVSDWLTAGGTAEKLRDLAAAAPIWEPRGDAGPVKAPAFAAAARIEREQVLEVVNRWLKIGDVEAVDVIMATAIAIYLPGDPLWLHVVAPPGGTKSELLRALQGPRVVSISTMTPQTLISGLKGHGEDIDLLPKLDGKLLIVKDFTSILSKKAEDQAAIFADLRETYDGYLEKSFGSGVGIKGYRASFGLITGVTPAIDMFRTVHTLLGERFLRVNVVGDEQGAVTRSSELEGQEKAMREEMGSIVGGFLSGAGEWFDHDILVEDRFLQQLRALAQISAALRSPVARDRYHHVLYPPQREFGTRLVKQLQKLAKALANWRERMIVSAEDYATVRRVALDCIPSGRSAVLGALLAADGWLTTKQVGQEANQATETANEHLHDLWMLKIVQREGDAAYSWAVTDDTRQLLERAAVNL